MIPRPSTRKRGRPPIELLEQALGVKARIERLAPQPGDVPVTYADISKAQTRLGYSPSIKIEQGIPLFVDWLARNTS